MSDVSLFLLTIASIFLVGIVGELFFQKTGIPDVVWLILVGIVLGPVLGFVDRPRLEAIAPYFGAITLVVVLFDGGSKLRLHEVSRAMPRALLLAVLGYVCTVLALAPASMVAVKLGILPPEWTWMHGIMFGCILGGSSSVVVMPALRVARIAPNLANLVSLESALTDVITVVCTGACIQLLVSGSTDFGEAALALGQSFTVGVAIGCVVGFASLLVLRRLKRSAYAYPLTLGTLLVVYVIVGEARGSAALAILAVAVLVGNAPALSQVVGLKKTASLGSGVSTVHDQIAFIIKSFFFTFIGAMLGPPWNLVTFGALLALPLLLGRIPASLAATSQTNFSRPARAIVAIAMPRGMASGVLAMFPYQAGVPGTETLPVIVFACAFASIVLFAITFAVFKNRLPDSELAPEVVALPDGLSEPPTSTDSLVPPVAVPGPAPIPAVELSALGSASVSTVAFANTERPPGGPRSDAPPDNAA